MSDQSTEQQNFAKQASEIVAAYVAHNAIPVAEVPNLIRSVHETLSGLNKPVAPAVAAESLKPAVPIKRSVTDEYIISLEDGRKFKSMKRYLAGIGMTPADYRAKWGLPSDYPMVAPAYAAKRSELARSSGLGRKAAEPAPELDLPEPEPSPEAEAATPAPKRGRKKAA